MTLGEALYWLEKKTTSNSEMSKLARRIYLDFKMWERVKNNGNRLIVIDSINKLEAAWRSYYQ